MPTIEVTEEMMQAVDEVYLAMALDSFLSDDQLRKMCEAVIEAIPTTPVDGVVVELVAVIEVLKHTVMEVRHAQESGPGWYTRGAGGLYQQVRLWLDKADVAIKSVEPEERDDAHNK